MKPDIEPALQAAPDITLLIAGLERKILAGTDMDQVRVQLTNPALWQRVQPEGQVRWAELAQMAGEIETASAVLAHVNRTSPEHLNGWLARLELLKILDDRAGVAALMAGAAASAPEAVRTALKEALHPLGPKDLRQTGDLDAAAAPFDAMRRRQALLQAFLDLFSGKEDAFARQWVDKEAEKSGYVPVRRPMEISDLEEHLSGRKTYGIYLMRANGHVGVAVLDADLSAEYRQKQLPKESRGRVLRERDYLISRVKELSAERGLRAWEEFSGGKGFHFWYFFDPPVKAVDARAAVGGIRELLVKDISVFSLEVFPKQDAPTAKGFGNLVKLPLGVHRATGKRSYFLCCNDRSYDAQLYFASRIERDRLKPSAAPSVKAPENLVVHPRWEQYAKQWPELHTLEGRCPPLGALIAACRNRRVLSQKETKVLYQSIGFLPRAKTLLHHLMGSQPEYNPHLVDFRLSRLRGTPLGCRRIHSLLNVVLDLCPFEGSPDYRHPLLHLGVLEKKAPGRSEKAVSLTDALENLKAAIIQVEHVMQPLAMGRAKNE